MACTDINVGVLGAGEIVEKGHLPVLLSLANVRVVWILDRSAPRLGRLRQMYRIAPSILIENAEAVTPADIILVALPFAARPQYDSLLTGGLRGVYLEKPLFASVADHRLFLSRFGPHAVGHGLQRRHTPLVRMLRDICATESLGPLRGIDIEFGGTVFLTVDRYSTGANQGHIGMLYETGTHWIDVAAHCSGAGGVETVKRWGKSAHGVELEVGADLRVARTNGQVFELRVRATSVARARNTMRFQFEAALLEVNPFGAVQTARLLDCGGHVTAWMTPLEPGSSDPLALLKANWTTFLQGMSSERETIASAATSVVTTEILQACHAIRPG